MPGGKRGQVYILEAGDEGMKRLIDDGWVASQLGERAVSGYSKEGESGGIGRGNILCVVLWCKAGSRHVDVIKGRVDAMPINS